jgi:cation:H+ antiporter
MALLELATLIIFTAMLAKSASLVIDNATVLSRFFGISQIALGMLLVSVSTSIPELSVSVLSSAAHEGAISAGNVFGSNIANILLILGIGALVHGYSVSRRDLAGIAMVLAATTIISVYIIFHTFIFGNALGFAEGAVLLGVAAWYAYQLLHGDDPEKPHALEKRVDRAAGLRAFSLFLFGIVLVLISSSIVVDSAVKISGILGLSKSFIGATVIAVGTSLPELSVDLTAIRRKKYSLALGDCIGSNMVNLTLVLGAAAVINPINVTLSVFIAALLFAVIANMVFFYLAAIKREFGRTEGAVLVLVYALYLVSIFYLQMREALAGGIA